MRVCRHSDNKFATSSEVSVLLKEWFHVLHMHSIVHVGVEFECGCLQLLVPETAIVDKLGVLLVIVAQTRHFTAFPREVAQEVGAVHAAKEEESVVHHRPLRDVLELDGVSCLNHLYSK